MTKKTEKTKSEEKPYHKRFSRIVEMMEKYGNHGDPNAVKAAKGFYYQNAKGFNYKKFD